MAHPVLRLCSIGLALLVGLLAPAQASPVCLVSVQGAAYQEASEPLLHELRSNATRAEAAPANAGGDAAASCPPDTRLIVTLGTEALRQTLGHSPRAAVLAGLIPRQAYERLLAEAGRRPAGGVAALYLDQPPARQLELLRQALPQARRVGVVWGPDSVAQQPALAAAAQARGLELVEATVAEGAALIGVLNQALRDADVLLAVADNTVYNSSTAAPILLTSYRARTPVLAFSPAYVKAGALLAVHTTPTQSGNQLAGMAQYFLQNGALPASQYPADFSVNANDYVARSLGLAIDAKALAERLRKQEKRP